MEIKSTLPNLFPDESYKPLMTWMDELDNSCFNIGSNVAKDY